MCVTVTELKLKKKTHVRRLLKHLSSPLAWNADFTPKKHYENKPKLINGKQSQNSSENCSCNYCWHVSIIYVWSKFKKFSVIIAKT